MFEGNGYVWVSVFAGPVLGDARGSQGIVFFCQAGTAQLPPPCERTARLESDRQWIGDKTGKGAAEGDGLDGDTGISGKAANSVAKKLKTISNKHQVLCISHLPNIAAMADYNYFISKNVLENRTKTDIKLLNEKEVIEEIARISSGEISEATLKYARELRNKKAS